MRSPSRSSDADGSTTASASTLGIARCSLFAHHGLAPWMSLVDDDRYQAAIDRFAALGVTAIAGAHTPLIPRSHIPAALDRLRTLPTADVPPVPDQAVLDAIRQQVAAAPAA